MEVDSDVQSNLDEHAVPCESDISADEEDSENENEGNPGLADALAKVIRMSKNKKGKSIVLSKAKLYDPNQVAKTKKKDDFAVEPDPNAKVKNEECHDIKPNIEEDTKPDKKLLKKRLLKKQERLHRGRLKPSPLDREKEKPLMRIATRGVVQLFNAVRQQQSKINKEINKPGVTEGKKEKLLKSIDKNMFLEALKGKNVQKLNSNLEDSNNYNDEVKDEPDDNDEEQPSWQVLRDDFMMGARLKDWDKNDVVING